jgi:hypothetical protein
MGLGGEIWGISWLDGKGEEKYSGEQWSNGKSFWGVEFRVRPSAEVLPSFAALSRNHSSLLLDPSQQREYASIRLRSLDILLNL